MPVGFQAINDSGVYQIDDTYKNLQLKTKASVTSMTQVNTGILYSGLTTYWYYDIVVTSATNPVVALNGNTTQWLIVGAVNISGGTWTFRVYSDADVDFTYYVFDVPTTSGTFGIEVFNSSGQLQYTSGLNPLRVKQAVTTVAADGNKTTTLTSGRTYAIATIYPGRAAISGFEVGDPKIPTPSYCMQQHYIGGFKLNGVTLTTNLAPVLWYDQYQGDDWDCGLITGADDAQRVLVLDVTNY